MNGGPFAGSVARTTPCNSPMGCLSWRSKTPYRGGSCIVGGWDPRSSGSIYLPLESRDSVRSMFNRSSCLCLARYWLLNKWIIINMDCSFPVLEAWDENSHSDFSFHLALNSKGVGDLLLYSSIDAVGGLKWQLDASCFIILRLMRKTPILTDPFCSWISHLSATSWHFHHSYDSVV